MFTENMSYENEERVMKHLKNFLEGFAQTTTGEAVVYVSGDIPEQKTCACPVTVSDGPTLNNFYVKTKEDDEKMEAYIRQMRKEEMERNGCLNTKQPKPTPSNSPYMWDLVLPDILERDHMGKEKHGTRLQAFNGRDVLKDAYQEALDTVVYLRQALYERDGK